MCAAPPAYKRSGTFVAIREHLVTDRDEMIHWIMDCRFIKQCQTTKQPSNLTMMPSTEGGMPAIGACIRSAFVVCMASN
jgi:hypothetical protein